jgi:hypothetical protein
MALPSNDKIVGDLGHTADHNAIVDEITFIKENYLSASGGLLDEYLRQDSASVTYATINSPIFTGSPTAPTASVDNNTTRIATTAFVLGQASSVNPSALGTAAVGNSLRYARANHVHPTTGLGLTSGTLAQFASTTSTQLAGVISDETGSGSLVFANSPTLLGVPVAPTASVNTNTSQIATTGFVVGQAGTASPLINGTASVGASLLYSRQDHVHPTDTTRAPLNSPAFTGTPTAPTAASVTNNTQIATTAFVRTAVSNLVDSAPTTLDTLNELAIALGNDPNFATTITNSLALKLDSGTASSLYLTISNASATYFPISSSGSLLTEAEASVLYLPISASSTLAPIGYLSSSAAAEIYLRQDSASSLYATIISPSLLGQPSAPTVSAGDISNRIATTEFVSNAVLAIQTGSANIDLSIYLRQDTASATYLAKNDIIDGGVP